MVSLAFSSSKSITLRLGRGDLPSGNQKSDSGKSTMEQYTLIVIVVEFPINEVKLWILPGKHGNDTEFSHQIIPWQTFTSTNFPW